MKLVGVDIGGTSIKLCISNEKGVIEFFKEYDSESKKGGKYLVEKLIKIISEFSDFDAIGISTAGQVDNLKGEITYANENIPNYTGTKLKQILESRFHVPVEVENDVKAAALGEKNYGSGKDFTDFLCLTYGTGVGGAIVMDSKLYHGSNRIAGEFGHIITHPSGLPCVCGGSGCYEMYASVTALVKKSIEVNGLYHNGRIIIDHYNQGNSMLEKVVEDWINEIAIGLISLIHAFNPHAIIIGGGIMERKEIVNMVSFRVKQLIIESFSEIKIINASLGNKAGVMGAISLHLSG
ncbi:ROK family protein [Aquibacillus halophilus]|uniref:ROK family protein n=1 Tax=Aquibacillus halophilus TaxID=930132 RepID=A0A6A8DBM1_9BACI|nr:ROK family protein [Aquibacillus halophilus]MRH41161.1 ROK family protein [Aquibacillus halophilus]